MIETVAAGVGDDGTCITVFLQVITCRSTVGHARRVCTSNESFQCVVCRIGPQFAIASHDISKTLVTVGVWILRVILRVFVDSKTIDGLKGIHEVLCRTVAASGILHTYREVVLLKGIACCQANTEDKFLLCIGILPRVTVKQLAVVACQSHRLQGCLVEHFLATLCSLKPEALVVVGVKQRTGMIQGCTCAECQHRQFVCTTCF